MNILQTIFNDHYEQIKYLLHPDKNVMENIDKMLGCGNPSFGGAFFGCPDCGTLKFVPFHCKSRFCTSCGNKYNQLHSFHMSCKLVSCTHRHCVFTIPEELRHFFLQDLSLLTHLFHAVRDVVLRMFSKQNKTENFTPGFICVLHTFGRDLKWNPHIHALISEGAAGNFTTWCPFKHVNYTFLRNAFCKVLLEKLTFALAPSFKKIKNQIFHNHSNGFYVRAKPNLCTPDITIKYISRYLGRPVIATSRIFWKFTIKKLHSLNAFERLWDMDSFHTPNNSIIVKSCSLNQQNKKFHRQRHGEYLPFALLLCHFLFLLYYTLLFPFEQIPIK